MKDDERTDSSSLNNYLNFDLKHFGNSPPNNKPITIQPGFSEAAYSEYVNIGKDGNEEAWRDHNNRGEFGMFVHWNSWRLVLCCGVWLLAECNKHLNYSTSRRLMNK